MTETVTRSSPGTELHIYEAEKWSPIILPESCPVRRTPPRPPEKRQPEYEDQFDDRTLFYDAFLWRDGAEVRLIGPQLFNLLPFVKDATVWLKGDEEATPLALFVHQKRKIAYLDVMLPDATQTPPTLVFDFGLLGQYEVTPGRSDLALFEGHRVAFTLFKFEPNHWVKDWAWFNVRYHGATALMVYHNDCDDRTTEDVAAAFMDIPGLELVVVANWPYPYGPSDGGFGLWDSNFCQPGMFEQMHWRYLQRAKSVLNSDIDELVVTENHQSIFEMTEQSADKHVKFVGHWISSAGDIPAINKRRHKDFAQIVEDRAGKLVEEKWALVPSAFEEKHRWGTHGIAKLEIDPVPVSKAGLRHFCAINTGWKLDRTDHRGDPEMDQALLEAYRLVGWVKS